MLEEENPLSSWESGRTSKVIVFSFLACLAVLLFGLFPNIADFYEAHPALRDVMEALVGLSGFCVAFLELSHSDEANKHRAERNRLARKANSLSDDKKKLYEQTLELQREKHELQQEIERKLTKVRLYARAHNSTNAIELLVSNLSDFDVWINQVRLVVTDFRTASPGTHLLGGGNRISRGHTEGGYQLYGKIISANANRTDRIDLAGCGKIVLSQHFLGRFESFGSFRASEA